jgi:hypothetical protein
MPICRLMIATIWFLCFAKIAKAEEAGDAAAADRKAKIQFEEGVRMFQEGDFDSAAIAFERAYELRPSYKILYNVGQVESELKHYFRASEAYKKYLDQGGTEISPERRNEVIAQIERLQSLFGLVDIKYSTDGVTVLIDGVRIGTTPLTEPSVVDMGTHELSLRDGIQEVYRESFRIGGGQRLTLALEGAAKPVPPSPSPATVAAGPKVVAQPVNAAPKSNPADNAPAKEKKKRKFTWVALGIAGAAGVSGGIVGGISVGKESSLTKKCDGTSCPISLQSDADKIQTMSLAADILYGVAGAAAAAAIVLFVVEPKRHSEKKVAWSPSLSPMFVGATGRF